MKNLTSLTVHVTNGLSGINALEFLFSSASVMMAVVLWALGPFFKISIQICTYLPLFVIGSKMEPYAKRCSATKITSAEKLMYICKNQLGKELTLFWFISCQKSLNSQYTASGMDLSYCVPPSSHSVAVR